MSEGIRPAVLDALKVEHRVSDFPTAVAQRAVVALGPETYGSTQLVRSWFSDIEKILLSTKIFLRMCWLKTVTGALRTSVRLHGGSDRCCICGCADSKDELRHYLICSILWQFAQETLHGGELSIAIGARLCFQDTSVAKLGILAVCHTLYHAFVKDPVCVSFDSGAPLRYPGIASTL